MITVRWADGHGKYAQVEFRRLFRPVKRPVPPHAEMVTAYTDGTVTLRSNRRRDGYHEAADMSKMQGVHVGDFVIHGLDILRGSVGISDSAGAISSVCTICEPIGEVDPRYFAWVIRAQASSGFPRALARGIREGGADFRRWSTLAELPVPNPAPARQRAIADYLDTETNRIDTLIIKKRRMVELLEERRQVLITAAVSSGQSHSGRKARLRFVAEVNPAVPGWANIPDDQPLVFLPLEAVWPGRVDYSRRRTKAEVVTGYTRFLAGDVIVPKITPTFEADRSTLVRGMPTKVGTGTTEIHVLRPSRQIERRYLNYLMSSRPFLVGGAAQMTGVAGQKRVPEAWIRNFPIPVLDRMKQRVIADRLDVETGYIDALITKKRRTINLLTERRQALITTAVTGERQVPEVAV